MHKGINELYSTYVSMTDTPVTKELYREIIEKFNEMAMDHIIAGGEFNMGYNLANLSIIRGKVNPRVARIDWKTSMDLKKDLMGKGVKLYDKETGEGEKWFVYHTTKEYVKFYWSKMLCRVKNCSVYRFDPTGGRNGNKEKLKKVVRKDDLAYLRFKRHGNL